VKYPAAFIGQAFNSSAFALILALMPFNGEGKALLIGNNIDGLVKSPSIPHSGRVRVVPRYAGLNSLQMAGEGKPFPAE